MTYDTYLCECLGLIERGGCPHTPHSTYHIPHTTYHIPHTTYHIPHTTYHIPHTTHHLPHTYHIPHTTHHIPHTTYHLPHTCVNVWVNPRLLLQIGLLDRKTNSFTTFFSQSLRGVICHMSYVICHMS
jgi:hypothetical protein